MRALSATEGTNTLDAEAVAETTPAPAEEKGDVVVDVEDVVEDVPETPVYIRLPGEEWSQTLTLEDVAPGDYIVEAMDADGNIYSTTVHVTVRDIVARQLRKAGAGWGVAAIAGGLGFAGLLLILLFAGFNVTVTVFGEAAGETKKNAGDNGRAATGTFDSDSYPIPQRLAAL